MKFDSNNSTSSFVVVGDRENGTTLVLSGGGQGNGSDSSATSEGEDLKDTFLTIFICVFILLVLALCTIFRPLLCHQPHRVHPVSQPEIVVDDYFFVRDFATNSPVNNEMRIIHRQQEMCV